MSSQLGNFDLNSLRKRRVSVNGNPKDAVQELSQINASIYITCTPDIFGEEWVEQILRNWSDADITDVIDVRSERPNTQYLSTVGEAFNYHALGISDSYCQEFDSWFAGITRLISERIGGSRKIVIHCQSGMNRAPSAVFRWLLENGIDPVEALIAIRNSRPVAISRFAPIAIDHYYRTHDFSESDRIEAILRVRTWLFENAIDELGLSARLHSKN